VWAALQAAIVFVEAAVAAARDPAGAAARRVVPVRAACILDARPHLQPPLPAAYVATPGTVATTRLRQLATRDEEDGDVGGDGGGAGGSSVGRERRGDAGDSGGESSVGREKRGDAGDSGDAPGAPPVRSFWALAAALRAELSAALAVGEPFARLQRMDLMPARFNTFVNNYGEFERLLGADAAHTRDVAPGAPTLTLTDLHLIVNDPMPAHAHAAFALLAWTFRGRLTLAVPYAPAHWRRATLERVLALVCGLITDCTAPGANPTLAAWARAHDETLRALSA
jgi:hypothetical protein